LKTDDPVKSADVLEREFMDAIRQADFLYLANIGGYVGRSAATETGVAVISGIPVVTETKIKFFSEEIPQAAQELLRKSVFAQVGIHEISRKKIAELRWSDFTSMDLMDDEKIIF
jgi:hypothetical protein